MSVALLKKPERTASVSDALTCPLELVSHPLFLGNDGEVDPNLRRWEMPSDPQSQDLLKKQPIVTIGGWNFVQHMGILPSWLMHDATRHDAIALIEERQWQPILDDLRAKENNPQDIFGKNSLRVFFDSAPRVFRDAPGPKAKRPRGAKQYTNQTLRLRKSIELVLLIEAALAYRFKQGRSLFRAKEFFQTDEVQPEMVWQAVWFEPVIFTISAPPREADLPIILKDEERTADFAASTGREPSDLYWISKGLPVDFTAAKEAARLTNQVYGNLGSCHAVTVDLDRFKRARAELAKANHSTLRQYPPPRLL